MHRRIPLLPVIPALLALWSGLLHAEFRDWRDTSGERSIRGQFMSRDASSVTILRQSRKPLTITFDKLHADDVRWLNEHHPLPKAPPPPPASVIADLNFGNTRTEVTKKLQASDLFEATIAETFFGRTGLNGVFKTKKSIGGRSFLLSFGWDEEGGLSEIIMQSDPAPAWDESMRACSAEVIRLLEALHGKPAFVADPSDPNNIANDTMAATHLWHLEKEGSALVGPSRSAEGFSVTARFTREKVAVQERKPAGASTVKSP